MGIEYLGTLNPVFQNVGQPVDERKSCFGNEIPHAVNLRLVNHS